MTGRRVPHERLADGSAGERRAESAREAEGGEKWREKSGRNMNGQKKSFNLKNGPFGRKIKTQGQTKMNPRIEINPAICHGQPVIRGTRVTVSQLLGSLSGGDSFQTVLEDYPGITADDLAAALSFAGVLARFGEASYEPAPA